MAQSRKSAARRKPSGRSVAEAPGVGAEAEAELSFEGALAELEETVGRLEAGEMPLEEALTLFERGVRLSRRCTTTLEAAERRIEMLVADRDDDAAEPFATDDSNEDDWDEDEDPDD